MTDKKKKNVGKVAGLMNEASSSVERVGHHKFSISGYVSKEGTIPSASHGNPLNFLTQTIQHNDLSNKKRASHSRTQGDAKKLHIALEQH